MEVALNKIVPAEWNRDGTFRHTMEGDGTFLTIYLQNFILFFNFKSFPTFLITSRLSGFFGTELVIGGFISSFFSILYGATIHSKKKIEFIH